MNQKPNLIYILADDMGYGDVSCLNPQAAFRTPNFDRLGREGIRFTDAHATSAVCTPSRYGILTGRYNWRSALKSGVLGGYSPALIEEGRKTVADLLRENGYATACVGKWHLGMDWPVKGGGTLRERPGFSEVPEVDFSARIENSPVTRGFDYYFGISASLDMPPYVYIENDRAVEAPDHRYPGVAALPDGAPTLGYARPGPCAPDFRHEEVLPRLTQKALEKIHEYKDRPFFLYFPLPAPHTPILPTEEFRGKSGANAYGDFCLMCDDVAGQVLRQLEADGIADNTIVIFTSDNGCSPHADFAGLAEKGHNPSYIFRGHKADIYEGGHRIPLLIRWPAGIPAGQCCGETVCLCDLMATMAELLGVSLPDDMGEDSVSNLSLWRGETPEHPLREAAVHQSIDGSLSIRKGRWKLELCPGSGGWSYPRPGRDSTEGMPEFQLYDLEADISEQNNVYADHPDVAKELKTLLTRYVLDGRSTPGAPQKNNGAPIWDTVLWLRRGNPAVNSTRQETPRQIRERRDEPPFSAGVPRNDTANGEPRC
ncbi:MAG TPA: arylsulfatase [Candidatus Merdivicinus intestinavium]|nr:arylsulfatase [Candidatus Merdivicinus intestinavium]